jgi:signal transduction histidine kinase/CheY-like chemotaxis protein
MWRYLVAAALVLGSAATLISMLSVRASEYLEGTVQLERLRGQTDRLNALEWRAIAIGSVSDSLYRDIDDARTRAFAAMEAVETVSPDVEYREVGAAFDVYIDLVDDELVLLGERRWDDARVLDEAQVDPSFRRLTASVDRLGAALHGKAATMARWSRVGSWTTFFGAFLVLAFLLRALVRAQRHAERYATEHRMAHEGEERMRVLLRNASDAVFLLDADGRIDGSLAGEGWGRQENGAAFDERIEASDRARVAESIGRARTQPSSRASFQARFLGGEDEPKRVEATVSNHLDDPRIGALVVVCRDVSEREVLAQRLERARRLEALGTLAGGVAHDFNNLLTAIVAYADLLSTAKEPRPELAREIGRAARHGSELTHQLLLFGRGSDTRRSVSDVNEVILRMASLLRTAVGEGVQLDVRLCEAPAPVSLPESGVKQILMNLAVNARDAMDGRGELRIHTSIVEPSSLPQDETVAIRATPHLRFQMEDTGSGMSAQVIERAFDPFFTTKSVGEGTGLGLSTVFGMVKAARGRVEVSSTEGRGTQVEILLPLSEAEADTKSSSEPMTVDIRPVEVLLVEDSAPVRKSIVGLLTAHGHEVIEAENADAALSILHSGRTFDLMLSDVVMPGRYGGAELASEVRRRRPETPIVLMSGFSRDELTDSKLMSDVTLLPKPFTWNELAVAMLEQLRRREPGSSDTEVWSSSKQIP